MKRVLKSSLSILLAIAIIFSSAYVGLSEVDFGGFFAVKAEAASSGTCGANLIWSLDDNGTLTISGTGAMNDYESYSPKAPWSSLKSNIKSVVIEDGVTSIGNYAFYACIYLEVATIGDSVISLGKYAFQDCNKLASIAMPEGLTSIGDSAFHGCQSFTSFFIPCGVSSIGVNAFYDCPNIEEFIVADGNNIYASIDGVLFNKDITKIIFYPKNKAESQYTIPDTVTSISNYAFYGCKNLASITIPESVTHIGNYAFSYSTSLTSITIPSSVTSIADYAFSYCKKLKLITICDGVTDIGNSAFFNCTGLVSITIPDSVTSIDGSAFSNCTSLTSIDIPDTVTSIDGSVFSNCTSLTSIIIPDSVTSIGSSAFYGCTSLTSISIPISVTSIGGFAFYGCTSLTSISIPISVTSIGSYAFYNCTSLSSVNYSGSKLDWNNISIGSNNQCLTDIKKYYANVLSFSLNDNGESYSVTFCDTAATGEMLVPSVYNGLPVTSIGKKAFNNCRNITSVSIPNSITRIDDYAFSNCYKLTAFSIPDSVTSIGSYAFSGCMSLTSVTIPDSVINMGQYVFSNCSSLMSIVIPGSFKSIQPYAFANCTGLTSIIIPDGVTTISEYAFYNCTGLTSITIPASVTSIADFAFQSCSKLSSVYINDVSNWCKINFSNPYSNPLFYAKKLYLNGELITDLVIPDETVNIAYDAFRDCTSLKSVTIPKSVKNINSYAFHNCTNLTDVYYAGSKVEWNKISINTNNQSLIDASIHYADNTCFSLNADGESYTFEGYSTAATGEIVIPSTYNGLPVTRIGVNALYNCAGVTSIVIPDTVTSIGSSAFEGTAYYNDDSNWEDNVLYIGEFLIEAKTDLSGSYSIKDGTRIISNYAFNNCENITSIVIPDSVEGIGEFAFNGCSNLKYVFYSGVELQWLDIVLGKGNTKLESAVLHYDTTQHVYSDEWTIDIPATCVSVGSKSHHCIYCDSKIDITEVMQSDHTYEKYEYDFDNKLKSSNCVYCGKSYTTKIEATDYLYFSLNSAGDAYTITGYRSELIGDFVVPSSYNGLPVTSIKYEAFKNCTNLTSIVIPDGITSIERYVFSGCSQLSKITIADSVTSIGYNVFNDTAYYKNLNNWENGVLYIDNHLIKAETTLNGVYKIKAGTRTIASNAFSSCKNLTSITIPDSVTDIGSSAFSTCISLAAIVISDNVTSIGGSAFYGCTSLTSIEIPDSVTSIGSYTFYNCTSLTSITIPDSVTSIDYYAFKYCSKLTSIEIPGSVTSIGESAFSNCTSLISINILDGVTSIGEYAFYACSKLNNITIADSVASIGYEAFGGTAYYSTLSNWKDDVLYIGNHLIKAKVTINGDYVIKNGTKTVANTAFYDCEKLTTITIPESLTSIGQNGFWHCYALTDVYYLGLLSNWDNIKIDTYNNSLTGAKLSHLCSFGDWVVESELSCTSDGVKRNTCKACGEGSVEITPATGHQNTEWIIEEFATCTKAGYKDEWCLDCGEIINTKEILATGHTNVEWTTVQEPTCIVVGYKNGYCLDCTEMIFAEEIPATGHQITEWITEQEPTCINPGYKNEYCLDCGELLNTQDILATGHSYGDWFIDIEPTCTDEGSKSHHCTTCGNKADITAISALGHRYSTEWTIDIKPTCTGEGSKSHHCTVCDESADITVVAPLGHNYVTDSVTQEHPHTTIYKCSNCLDTKDDVSYSDKCALCNFTYTDIDALTCKITGYIGSSTSFVIPATINDKTVSTTTTGAFKNNTTLTSIEIDNGVTGIGSLAFLGCSALSKIVIPESVTSIGTKAFYNCASDFTIYCFRDSYAMQYAIDNNHNYVIMDIGVTSNSVIDYSNKLIYTTSFCTTKLEDIVYVPLTSSASTTASIVQENIEYLGTGSKVIVTNGSVTVEYTLIVNGDTNGDSVCDVLDCFEVERAANGNGDLTGAYAMAADSNADDVVDITDYQAIVNKAVS